jgi:hypothetical protein
MIILYILVALLPVALYFSYQVKRSSPSEHWPVLSTELNLSYEDEPARMTGDFSGRRAQISALSDDVTLTMWLKAPTRLRVECGPKAVAPKGTALKPITAIEPAFGENLLAWTSDAAAGANVFDTTLQIRLAYMARVKFNCTEISAVWTVPDLKDAVEAKAILHGLTAVAEALERFPLTGGAPRA